MKKLIELGVAIDIAIGAADEYDGGYNFERDRKIRDALMALPTVDAVEVVRCKDCKYWKDSDGVYRRGFNAESKCPLNTKEVYAGTFYCGYAERRTDEGSDRQTGGYRDRQESEKHRSGT